MAKAVAMIITGIALALLIIYGADAAIEFLKTQESVWTKWVPSSVAKKVKAAL